jgi:hypothetical protein
MTDYPLIFRLRQTFERPRVEDIPATVQQQLSRLQLGKQIRPGQTVAITAGSRGIANIRLVIRAIADHCRQLGAQPFILAGYGITEDYCECPIRASMETVVVCQAAEGFPVHFDKHAYGADHVVVCGRVKPHTNFYGDIESGLMKMMLDADRPGQTRRREDLSPGHQGLRFRPDCAERGSRSPVPLPDRRRRGDCRKRL